ncbi:MAG: hypothetical protein LCH84_15905 [Gemmatimonadetes bacterium]|nr:hypothetical protein [Gemmatimonadota bacterium]
MTWSRRAALCAVLLSCGALMAARSVPHLAWDGMVLGKGKSKIRGDVSMEGGKTPRTTIVSVAITGDTPASVRGWHVHRGSCAKPGRIFGAAQNYVALRVGRSGEAQAMASLRVAVPDTGEFYADVHEGALRPGAVIACGDLLMEE